MTFQDVTINKGGNKNSTVESDFKHKRVSFPTLLKCLMKQMSRETLIFVIVLSSIFLYFWNMVNYCEDQIKQLCNDGVTVLSCVLGLTITGFSIILTLDRKVVKELSYPFESKGCRYKWLQPIEKWLHPLNSNPYGILCSSFVWCCIILIITIISLVLYKNQPGLLSEKAIFFSIIKWLCVISSLFVLDVVFHLFAVSSYIRNNNTK